MKYFIIGPNAVNHHTNAGGHMITAGVKWLLMQVDRDAMFWDVMLAAYSPKTWDLLRREADWIVYAGHPRFNAQPGVAHYWDTEVWDHIEDAIFRNVRFFDAWAGGSHQLPLIELDKMASWCREIAWVKRILRVEAKSSVCIVRDELAEAVFAPDVPHLTRLPCCSWFARRYYNVEPVHEREYNLIVLTRWKGKENLCQWAKLTARRMSAENNLPTRIVVHGSACWEWCKEHGLDGVLPVYDPLTLLRLFAKCDLMVSMRVHATVPAMSLGCKVWHVGMDARLLTIDEFDVMTWREDAVPPDNVDLNFQAPGRMPSELEYLDAMRGITQ